MKNYNTFGVMIDMSRNAVMSLEGLRRFFPLLKRWATTACSFTPRTPTR